MVDVGVSAVVVAGIDARLFRQAARRCRLVHISAVSPPGEVGAAAAAHEQHVAGDDVPVGQEAGAADGVAGRGQGAHAAPADGDVLAVARQLDAPPAAPALARAPPRAGSRPRRRPSAATISATPSM